VSGSESEKERFMTERVRARAWGPVAVAGSIAVLLAAGCGPREPMDGGAGPDRGGDRFAFIRNASHILRTDTATGQVWVVPMSGDGGWEKLAPSRSAAGRPQRNERYALYFLDRPRQDRSKFAKLLLVDRATGRTWVGESSLDSEWLQVAESAGSPLGDEREEAEPAEPVPYETSSAPGGAESPQNPDEPDLQLIPAIRFGATAEEQNANIGVVMEALYKEGLPVEIKVWGARQLGLLLPEVAVPRLIEALDHQHPQVVVAAIDSLQQIGDPATIPRIFALQNHTDPAVRDAAQAALTAVR